MKLEKDRTRCSQKGAIFEHHLAGIIALRLRALRRRIPSLHFLVATNVQGANPFDDIVVHLSWQHGGRKRAVTYFLQLKHKDNTETPVPMNDLTGKVPSRNKDFNLRHYFRKFQEAERKLKAIPEEKMTVTQRALREWLDGDFRLVLFTTKEVHHHGKDTERTTAIDFPLEELLAKGKGESFRFEETDAEVWNMFNGAETEVTFRSRFLERLRVFSGQAPAQELLPLLAEAIQKALDGLPPRLEALLAVHARFLHEWWEGNDGECLSEETGELECAVRQDIHGQLQCFRFEPAICIEFTQEIAKHDVSYIVVSDVPTGYRCSITMKCMEEIHPERYIILTDSAFKEYNWDILHSICYKLCDSVIFNVDKISEKMLSFLKTLLSDGRFRIRILTSELQVEVYNFLATLVGCNAWKETWSLAQLISEEREVFLENKVCFQGRWIQLKTLVEAWPSLLTCIGGSALAALASGQPVSLGAPLTPVDPFYVPRTVLHHATVSQSIFGKLQSAHDYFALIGFPEFILKNIRREDSLWEEKSWEEIIYKEDFRTSALDDAQKYEGNTHRTKWCVWNRREIPKLDLGNKRVHWLSYETDQIVWRYSVGDTSALASFVEKRFENCHCSYLCQHDDPCDFLVSQALILSDGAGMGKSTFINFMANAFKDIRKTDWVIVVNLNDHFIEQLPQNMDIDDIINFLEHYVEQNTNSHPIPVYPFLRNCFLNTNNLGHFQILLDGFDELSSTHQIIAVEFLKLIKYQHRFNGTQFLVATRTMLEQDLAEVLDCPTPLSLRPFSREDQLRYYEKRCRQFVERGRTSSSEGLFNNIIQATSGLCEVPLYAGMLADALADDDLQIFLGDTSPLSYLSRVALYRKFLQKTISLFWEKVGLPTRSHEYVHDKINEAFEDHKMLAARVVFKDKYFPRDIYDSFKKTEEKMSDGKGKGYILRIGIVTRIVKGKPQFQHYSFAEYLAAAWLYDRYVYTDKNELVEVLYTNGGSWENVRYFFDALLAESGSTLHRAALTGHLDPNEPSLSNHKDVNQLDKAARYPLHIAAIYGREKVVRLLLNCDAFAAPIDRVLGWTPLQYIDAIVTSLLEKQKPVCRQHEERILQYLLCAEELLVKCENPKIDRKLFRERFLLYIAIKNDLMYFTKTLLSLSQIKLKRILKNHEKKEKGNMVLAVRSGSINVITLFISTFGYKIDINDKYSNKSLLHIAADRGHGNVCALLIENGLEVNARDENNCTPLHLAARSFVSVCKILLVKKADIHAKNQDERFPLHFATWQGQDDICRLLIQHGAIVNSIDRWKQSPLHLAAMKGHVSTCCVLLDNGGTTEARDVDGMTPLLIAANKGHLSMCRFLIRHVLDINVVDDEGRCALSHAAGSGSQDLCKMFLENGCKFQGDSHKNNPLHVAALCNHANVCKLFLDHGFDVNARNKEGRTALHLTDSKHVILVLLAKNADINIVDFSKYTALHYAVQKGRINICRILIKGGIDIDAKTKFGYTALHLASRSPREDICELLVESRADVNATDNSGNTALHTLLMKDSELSEISFKEDFKSVKYIIKSSQYTYDVDCEDITLCSNSDINGILRISRLCHLFVDKGANVHHLNLKGEKPFDIASHNSLVNVCEILNNAMLKDH